MNYNKIMLFMLLTIALYCNKSSSMQLDHTHSFNSYSKSALLVPLFYLVHSDSQLTDSIESGGYFTFPKPVNNFIDPERYAQKFEKITCKNLIRAQKNGINQETRDRYARRLIAEQYCTKYDMKAMQHNRLHPSDRKSHLLPSFHPVCSNNDIATHFAFDENKKFYSYPKPVNASINIPFYKRTVIKTLKINIIMAHEQGLDDDAVIKPYICRILDQIEWDSYNLAILQNPFV